MTRATYAPAPVIGSIIAKLIDVIEEENRNLSSQPITSHATYTDRKNQVLRELIVAQRRGIANPSEPGLRELLEQLSGVLQINANLLKHHISAVGEVSDIIVSSLKDAESDGTYSRCATLQDRR